ncbi:hypothetical protein ACIPX0_37760 [Streptomyces sp. NPDC090075]|uniref:hypothetical protein n=1 Tax=Streptomyces sp. NPDC090075 TaxID=3365937 RepID=UPI0037F6E4C6
MSFPPPSRTPWGVRRRSLIVSAASAAVLAGCSTDSNPGSASSAGSPSLSARARARAARDSEGLLRSYDAVLAAHPTLAERLRPLRAEVAAHAAAFREGAAKEKTAGGSTASAGTTATGSPSASAPEVPADEKSALASLATAERSLADQRAKALLEVPGELARLLAGVAAAGAGHAYLLTRGDQ